MKNILMCLTLLPCFLVCAQKGDFREARKGKLFFKIGTEYRITPLPTDGVSANLNIGFTNSDLQNAGAAIYYGFDFFATKNLSLGFSHSFRYALLNFANSSEIIEETGQKGAKYNLFMGYHFYVDYHVKVFKNAELFARVGISLSNRNSNYTYKQTFFDNDGNIIGTGGSQFNYTMQPKNYAVGYKKDKLELLLGIYATNDAPYFDQSTPYIIPYINLNYTLGKL